LSLTRLLVEIKHNLEKSLLYCEWYW